MIDFSPAIRSCVAASRVQEFDTRPRDDWRGEMSALALIVPSTMSAITGMTKDGKESKHTFEQHRQPAFFDLRI